MNTEQTKEILEIDLLTAWQRGVINDALQSNYQALSILTDAQGLNNDLLGIHEYLTNLKKRLPPSAGIGNLIESLTPIIIGLLDLTTQVNYTGRCLNGMLSPYASVHTCQRDHDWKHDGADVPTLLERLKNTPVK